MKIILASSFVPFIHGGARNIVEWLEAKLIERGHLVERFYLPFIDRPEDLLDQTLAFRLIDLADKCDRLITFRPPSHVLRHPNKVLWFIHHIRTLYDLWDSPHAMVPHTAEGHALRRAVIELDNQALGEANRIFTNSNVVAQRLQQYNGISATTLYPPIYDPGRFSNLGYGDEVVFVSRIEPHKRQWLLIEAMRYTKTPVKLRLCGTGSGPQHVEELKERVGSYKLSSQVTIDGTWVSEEEKARRVGQALAVAYIPLDEDSYGYPSLEAAHAEKPVLTTADSGGVLELVTDNVNGYVVSPDPEALAEAMDRLYTDREQTSRMGRANLARVAELQINWDHVLDALTS